MRTLYERQGEADGTQSEPKIIYTRIHTDLPEYFKCSNCSELFTGSMAWRKHRTIRNDGVVTCLPTSMFADRGMSQNKYGVWIPFKPKHNAKELKVMREQIQTLMGEYLESVAQHKENEE